MSNMRPTSKQYSGLAELVTAQSAVEPHTHAVHHHCILREGKVGESMAAMMRNIVHTLQRWMSEQTE